MALLLTLEAQKKKKNQAVLVNARPSLALDIDAVTMESLTKKYRI